jgi:hypothetical protein
VNAQVLVLVVVVALAVVFVVLAKTGRSQAAHVTPLMGVAFAFVIAGIVFGEDRLLGYVLMGVGVALAVIDIVRRSRHRAA